MKGALELSVNAIVILIIALAVLGLVIGFAVSKFTDLSGQLETTQSTPDATAQQPITLPGGSNKLTIEKNKQTSFEIKVYNKQTQAITVASDEAGDGIALTCAPSTLQTSEFRYPSTTINPGQMMAIPIVARAIPQQATGQYSCSIYIGGITRTVFVEVN